MSVKFKNAELVFRTKEYKANSPEAERQAAIDVAIMQQLREDQERLREDLEELARFRASRAKHKAAMADPTVRAKISAASKAAWARRKAAKA